MKLDILFHYDVNEQTGEITYIGKEEIHVDTVATKKAASSKSSSAKVDENPEPIITLDSNKLILTQGAVDLLQVCADCRVDIKYKKKDKKAVPIIGTEDKGIYYLIGDKVQESNPVPEEIIDIEKELDIEALDNLNIDEDDKNLEKFDFNLN